MVVLNLLGTTLLCQSTSYGDPHTSGSLFPSRLHDAKWLDGKAIGVNFQGGCHTLLWQRIADSFLFFDACGGASFVTFTW